MSCTYVIAQTLPQLPEGVGVLDLHVAPGVLYSLTRTLTPSLSSRALAPHLYYDIVIRSSQKCLKYEILHLYPSQ